MAQYQPLRPPNPVASTPCVLGPLTRRARRRKAGPAA